MTKRIETKQSPPVVSSGEYFHMFGQSAWKGSYVVSCVCGAIVGVVVLAGKLFLRSLVRVGGFCFGVILALACLVGLGYLVSLLTGKGD